MFLSNNLDQRGFTLVELLIVVIILAILAAIVVPQFASSTDDAKISSLDATLSNIRAASDLYYQQHGEYPSAKVATGGTDCAAGTPGDGAVDTKAAFLQQLAWYTNVDGAACTQRNGTKFPYGPYLKKAELPANPVTGNSTLAFSATAGDLNMVGDGVNLGWKLDNVTGKFIANDTSNDPNGNSYDSH